MPSPLVASEEPETTRPDDGEEHDGRDWFIDMVGKTGGSHQRDHRRERKAGDAYRAKHVRGHTMKLSPQPQAPLALGFSNTKPAEKSSSTQSITLPTRYNTLAPSM